jgi:hypothetical protein
MAGWVRIDVGVRDGPLDRSRSRSRRRARLSTRVSIGGPTERSSVRTIMQPVAYASADVVTRRWIGYLLTTEMTSTQAKVQVLSHQAGRPAAPRRCHRRSARARAAGLKRAHQERVRQNREHRSGTQ